MMGKDTLVKGFKKKNDQESVFEELFRRSHIREENPEKYDPSRPVLNWTINILIFLTALFISVIGLVFYGIWRDENIARARLGLAGFLINLILLIQPLVLLFFTY
ncbi:MAG: hypothetical protein ACOC2X_03005 [Bacillota bacterium]